MTVCCFFYTFPHRHHFSLINNRSEKNLTPRAMFYKYINLNTLRMLSSILKTMKREQRVAYIEYSLFEIKLDKHDEHQMYTTSLHSFYWCTNERSPRYDSLGLTWLHQIYFFLFTIITVFISLMPIDVILIHTVQREFHFIVWKHLNYEEKKPLHTFNSLKTNTFPPLLFLNYVH